MLHEGLSFTHWLTHKYTPVMDKRHKQVAPWFSQGTCLWWQKKKLAVQCIHNSSAWCVVLAYVSSALVFWMSFLFLVFWQYCMKSLLLLQNLQRAISPLCWFSAKHIIKIDGKVGLFKGLGPRLCAGTIGTVVHSKIAQVGTIGEIQLKCTFYNRSCSECKTLKAL